MSIKYSFDRVNNLFWHLCFLSVGHLRRCRTFVRRTWLGNDPCRESMNHAVYAHYDRVGTIHDYVVEQVRQLAIAGFRVTFVSNARRLSEASIAAVRPFCREMVWRRNVGYDFGAYKDGIAAIGDLTHCNSLVLTNDSIYGPFWPLSDVLKAANSFETDLWGVTDSWDGGYHVQTYFILFHKKAISSKAFGKFWRNLPYVSSKSWIIKNCEVKLTQKLTQQRLRAAALCPYWHVANVVWGKLERRSDANLTEQHKAFLNHLHANIQFGRPLNPTHFFWDTLISEFNCPFIKRELIRINPEGVVYNWRWHEVVARSSDYDLSLIERHMQAS